MGNIKSCCCRDAENENDDHEERSRIIDNICDGAEGSCEDIYSSSHSAVSRQDTPSYGSITDGNKVEQTALNRILQKMASNVIDVTPGESMLVRQGDFVERQRAYQHKLNLIKVPLVLRSTLTLRTGFNNPIDFNTTQGSQTTSNKSSMDTRRVNYEPISVDDIQTINLISQQSAMAVKNGLRIESEEPIVAQFNPG